MSTRPQQNRRQPRRRQQQRPSSSSKWAWYAIGGIGGAVGFVLIILFATGVLGGGGGNINGQLSDQQVQSIVARGHVEGFPEAPVTLIEFGDFQCPFCRQFWDEGLRTVRDAYVAQGAVKVVFHHMAFLGQESLRAAEASECAAEQDKFFEYHDVLFDKQGPENQGYLTTTRLLGFGEDAGLDMAAFEECVLSRKYQQEIIDDTNAARELSVNSTPTVLVDGKRIGNPINASLVFAAIESALAGDQ